MAVVVVVSVQATLLFQTGLSDGGALQLRHCRDLCSPFNLLQRTDTGVVVLDLKDWSVESSGQFIRGIRRRFPAMPVIGIVHPDPGGLRRIVPAVRAGITEIALVGIDDLTAIVLSAQTDAYAHAVASVISHVAPALATDGRAIVEYCVRQARRGIGVKQLCAELCQSRSTLRAVWLITACRPRV